MATAYITHASSKRHQMSAEHPESPQRLWAINDALISQRLLEVLVEYDATPVTRQQLIAAHDIDYVERIYRMAPKAGTPLVSLDVDTWMNSESLTAAEYAAGAVCLGVDKVMDKTVKNAFCATRPPGHHAERDRAMGFCIFNNIAIGACHALQRFNLSRVAIVDFDVHHGNGTEHIFRHDPRVLFCSSYQHPLFPNSAGKNRENQLINMPLSAGSKGDQFRKIIQEQCLPAIDRFAPEFIFISAGFDAHASDPLASLFLLEDDFAWITQELVLLANKHCQGRIVASLEGGYDLEALGRSVVAHLKELAHG